MNRPSLRVNKLVFALAVGGAVTASVLSSAPSVADTAAQEAHKPIKPPKPYRLADGHPNWTGFWSVQGGLLENDIGLGGTPAAGSGPPPSGALPTASAPPPGLKPGEQPPEPPDIPFSKFSPMKPPYDKQLGVIMQKFMTGHAVDPVALCLPPGMPRMMIMAYGMELLQTPGQIAITSEWQAASRRIWLDRKTHPPADELDPSYTGDSVGHWQGDTLVVDTVGIRDDVPLNFTGLPHSPQLHVVEHFHEPTPGTLVDDIEVIDPGAFTKPWYQKMVYHNRPDLRIEEYVCLENNRNVSADGSATFQK